jgi:uncharacterized protein YbbC (DUF1343 family)
MGAASSRWRWVIGYAAVLLLCWIPGATQSQADAASCSGAVPGMYRLLDPAVVAKLRGKRLGILAHPASIGCGDNSNGQAHLVNLVRATPGLEVTQLFAAEHGIWGDRDRPFPHHVDPRTGLPVHSLYKPKNISLPGHQFKPTPESLSQVDVLVIDLQDVGMRFYTYSTTMAYAMEAAKENGKEVVILDRPNPMGGTVAGGPVPDADRLGSFTSYFPVQMRHGLTMGELAFLFDREFGIGLGPSLSVFTVKHWSPQAPWQSAGLNWVAPSPALQTPDQAVLYGLIGAMETLDLAVGRGIVNGSREGEFGFRVYGAPWIRAGEPSKLANALNQLKLPGLRFSAVEWKVTLGSVSQSKYAGQRVRGFQVDVTDARALLNYADADRILIDIVRVMRKRFGTRFKTRYLLEALGSRSYYDALVGTQSPATVLRNLKNDPKVIEYRAQRARSLCYGARIGTHCVNPSRY